MAVSIPRSLPQISDDVIALRGFTELDAPVLARIWRDPMIRAHNSVPEPSESAARDWVARALDRVRAGEAWEWAIVEAGSGELIGRRALKQIDWPQRRAVAAAWVAAEFRGRRYAARSLRLAAAYAFDHGIVRIHAECETDNHASLSSIRAAGMRYEGTLRAYFITEDGAALDLHVFGMLREDLLSAPALAS